jgi:hypothetical protein
LDFPDFPIHLATTLSPRHKRPRRTPLDSKTLEMYFMSDPFAFRKERFVGGIGIIRRAGKSEGNQLELTKWENAPARERLLAEADETNESGPKLG